MSGYLAGRGETEVERIEREVEERTERIIVREPDTSPKPTSQPRPTTRPTPRPPDNDDEGVTRNIPKVPLPEQVGKPTDEVKDMVDDLVKNPLP